MAARCESTVSLIQESAESSTDAMDSSIFHGVGAVGVASGLNGGGGQAGGVLETSSDRATARGVDMMFFPQSREPQQAAPSLFLRGVGSGQSIAGSPASATGAGQGYVADIRAAAVSFGHTSGLGFAGVGSNNGGPGAAAAGMYEPNARRSENQFAGFGPESFGGLLGSASSPT